MAADQETQPIEWQVLPFRRSLSEKALMFGVPKAILVLNGLLAYMFIANFHFWYILAVNALVHFGSIYLAKNDDQFFECLRNYQMQQKYYST